MEGLSYQDLPVLFHYYNFSLNLRHKYLRHFREQNPLPRSLESSKYQESFSSACFCWKKNCKLYQQNRIKFFYSFVDQATPGFELGKKDLQSPALPLGHVAKTIQKIYENIPFFWGGLLIFVLVS